jgi:hypothetical protein
MNPHLQHWYDQVEKLHLQIRQIASASFTFTEQENQAFSQIVALRRQIATIETPEAAQPARAALLNSIDTLLYHLMRGVPGQQRVDAFVASNYFYGEYRGYLLAHHVSLPPVELGFTYPRHD